MELQLRRTRYVSVPNTQNEVIADAPLSQGVTPFRTKINSSSMNAPMSISLGASPPLKRQ